VPLDEVTLEDGTKRRLGNLVPSAGLSKDWPRFGETPNTPLITRVYWKQFCLAAEPASQSFFLPPVHDQDGIGMCNASATCAAMEARRARSGLTHVPLSGGDLYMRICGGSDRGSLLEDGIAASMAEGVTSTAVTPYLDWRGENAGAAENRKRFRVTEAYLCPTFDHCMSAVILGFDLISGIMWYSNYTPDADGWLPPGRGNAGGHAVYGFAPAERNGQYGIWHRNSWGKWGWKGTGLVVFPEAAYAGPVGGWWAVRSVVDEGGVVPLGA
jgi:hypothetical protein